MLSGGDIILLAFLGNALWQHTQQTKQRKSNNYHTYHSLSHTFSHFNIISIPVLIVRVSLF